MLGRIPHASNLAVLAEVAVPGDWRPPPGERVVRGPSGGMLAVYKPVRGERPLWDFPDGTLAAREVAAHLVSVVGGWDLVPPTVLREGPLGLGSLQAWVGGLDAAEAADPDQPDPTPVVDVFEGGEVPRGWIEVFEGVDLSDRPVVVAHRDDPALRAVAVLDVLINNADRKGSHLLRDGGEVRAIDHGVCFHAAPKLRTVLWGWAGEPVPPAELERVGRVLEALGDGSLAADLHGLLDDDELAALRGRTERLLRRGVHPAPDERWPAIPWPPL